MVFAGGLVFAQRIPTTPHAQIAPWLQSLQAFAALPAKTLVPSHGPVHADGSGLAQTTRYLRWLDRQFAGWAMQGWDMNEVLRAPPPEAFARWAAWPAEYTRNVAHLYPGYERAALQPRRSP